MTITMNKVLKDSFIQKDRISQTSHQKSIWAKTQVLFGYDLYKDKYGVSQLGEVVFEGENLVPLVGVQFVMEQLFGVKGTTIHIPTLNETMGIASSAHVDIDPAAVFPTDHQMPYPFGHRVCLFGVGIDGAKDNNITAKEVSYKDWNVSGMVPFRYTNDTLTDEEKRQYFGKKVDEEGIQCYYLKAFSAEPVIHHVFKSGIEGVDGAEVDSDYLTSDNQTGVQSFTESILIINRKDIREWFEYNDNIEKARFNSIGLFSGTYDATVNDFANIQLFSKLNIPTEPLLLSKDVNVIYRVYGA